MSAILVVQLRWLATTMVGLRPLGQRSSAFAFWRLVLFRFALFLCASASILMALLDCLVFHLFLVRQLLQIVSTRLPGVLIRCLPLGCGEPFLLGLILLFLLVDPARGFCLSLLL